MADPDDKGGGGAENFFFRPFVGPQFGLNKRVRGGGGGGAGASPLDPPLQSVYTK